MKFEKEKVLTVIHIEESPNYVNIPNEYCYVFSIVKRFDQWIWPEIIEERGKPFGYTFSLTSLETKQKLIEILDLDMGTLFDSVYFVNWNMNEIARTFCDRDDNSIFKISRRTTSINMTLKQLSSMVVLSSFSEEYLSNQNLPSTLFEYMGMKRK